ncbi:hypothetical protein PoB_003871900 [Plakobranchus ocellatus]|uniref:Uncharacterized protein n=1 Tax=Plakobranchus ocellatus TaxID=259542 RepID=A0AAV4AWN9_9GAST|nr:hypothetical protein PoB_003871900 [Plakobranchus ocellatus]
MHTNQRRLDYMGRVGIAKPDWLGPDQPATTKCFDYSPFVCGLSVPQLDCQCQVQEVCSYGGLIFWPDPHRLLGFLCANQELVSSHAASNSWF